MLTNILIYQKNWRFYKTQSENSEYKYFVL